METTKNEMPEYAKYFFNRLSNYLDTKLYFYGSIQRKDYFPKSSDIDVDIFTDNMTTTISKMQHFFGVKRDEFKKVVYKLRKTEKVIHGYKFKYKDLNNNFKTELSIYDEKYKDEILLDHNSRITIPFYLCWILIILKYFYYDLGIISKTYFHYFKDIIMNCIDGKNAIFVVIEIPKDKPDE